MAIKTAGVFLILVIFISPDCISAEGSPPLITPQEYRSFLAEGLDALSWAEEQLLLHEKLGHRFSVHAKGDTVNKRYICETNLGLLMVSPSISSMGLFLDICRFPFLEWTAYLSAGFSNLTPYIQTTAEDDHQEYGYTTIYTGDIFFIHDLRFPLGISLMAGMIHRASSPEEEGRFYIEPGSPMVYYSFNLKTDQIILKTNVLRFLLELSIAELSKGGLLGYSFDTGTALGFLAGLALELKESFWATGPLTRFTYKEHQGIINAGFRSGAPVPLYGDLIYKFKKEFRLIEGLEIPLYLEGSASFNPLFLPVSQEEENLFLWGFKIQTGLTINPRFKRNFMSFHILLKVSMNNPGDLRVFPIPGTLFTGIDFGFHFF